MDFKEDLWKSANKLRNQMDAAEYKHIVLGLIFLKYISDTFDIQKNKIKKMVSDKKSDFFVSENPFFARSIAGCISSSHGKTPYL